MKTFQYLILAFMTVTIAGTVLHELGHAIPAKLLGYKTQLHYGSTSWEGAYLQYSNRLFQLYPDKNSVPKAELEKLSKLKSRDSRNAFWITLGGPIQTMATGLIGFLILYRRRRTWRNTTFGLINWTAVFLSLFWSRQLFNLLSGVSKYLLGNSRTAFIGDEAKIATALDLPLYSVTIGTSMISLIICYLVVFHVVPKECRKQFIFSAIVGSTAGYILWFQILGPILLP